MKRLIRKDLVGRKEGYALVASMMILLLITALGVLAMVSSTSEQMITTNLGMHEMVFFYAEQAVDRILSHLHYLEGGIFSNKFGLGFDPTQSSNYLAPVRVLHDEKAFFWDTSGINKNWQKSPIMMIDAYIDPKDFEHALDRGLTRELAVSIRLRNRVAHIDKAYRVLVRPKSVWDFAYYALNHNPIARRTANLGGETCTGASQNWYTCQTAFLHGDVVAGDTYVSNATFSPSTGFSEPFPDTARLFVRGGPAFLGQVRWRNPDPFDYGALSGGSYSNSQNQTKGGNATLYMPNAGHRMRNYSRPVLPPKMDVLTHSATTDGKIGYHNSGAYDLKFPNPGTNMAWKVIFRNDMDTVAGNGRATSRVASAYTHSIHPGTSPTLGNPTIEDRGTMMIYKVRYYSSSVITQEAYRRAAHYGDSARRRHIEMTAIAGADIWDPSKSWGISGKICHDFRDANAGTFGPADAEDLSHYFMYVPSRGLAATGSGSGCSGTFKGVIYFEGDVLVSGILDGQVTIVAAGNIILDHEVRYENSPTIPLTNYASYTEPDILGLYATGDVIIPNSRPNINATDEREIYWDDWSDAHYDEQQTGSLFSPTGFYEHPNKIIDDTGDEEIHAVILSYAYEPCSLSGSNMSCTGPSSTEIRQFRTGFHATARTRRAAFWPEWNGEPFYNRISGSNVWIQDGNDSGQLKVVGAVIQNIPGRLAYDYYSTAYSWANSTCTNGAGSTCRRMGFSKIDYVWDERLKNLVPPYPRQTSPNYIVPYGYAAYDILSWEEIETRDTDISQDVW